MSERRAPAEVVEALRTAIAALDLAALVEAGRAAVAVLDSAPTWTWKTRAAEALGVDLETVRNACRRGHVRTRHDGTRELVDLHELRRYLATAARPEVTASREHDEHSP